MQKDKKFVVTNVYIYIYTILEENNIQEVLETDRKSSLTIDLLTGLKHSVLVQVEDETFKMYRYIIFELTVKCEEEQRHPFKM